MNLKTRILVGFILVILMPMLLLAATLYGYQKAQDRRMDQETELVEMISDEYVYDIAIGGSSLRGGRVRLMNRDVFMSISVILLFTAVSVGLWIYRSIASPLVKLRKATQNIKEGNLDFVLDVEGSGEFAELCQDFEEMR
ncbi:MAG: HAMP domain-containing protein, partial [Clostridiales bacterium]|nr:HAMP domain-containing protein [Candidatus Blautia equi]